jgi:hypothetical protein
VFAVVDDSHGGCGPSPRALVWVNPSSVPGFRPGMHAVLSCGERHCLALVYALPPAGELVWGGDGTPGDIAVSIAVGKALQLSTVSRAA